MGIQGEGKELSRAFLVGGGKTASDTLMQDFSLNRFSTRERRRCNLSTIYRDQQKLRSQYRKERGLRRVKDSDFEGWMEKNGKKDMLPLLRVADLPESQQIEATSYGEYIKKPYDQSVLASLVEMNQRLRSCSEAVASNSVRLGVRVDPYLHPHIRVSDYDDAETTAYKEQKLSLIKWLNFISPDELDFVDIMYEFVLKWQELGECFLEIVEDASGKVTAIHIADPTNIWVGVKKDRFIQMSRGKKVYFRKFFDDGTARSSKTFEEVGDGGPVPFGEHATKLLHIKEPNSLSSVYGIPKYTPSAPTILGGRSADERNKTFFDNDAVPRMAITISGGSLADDTVEKAEEFFDQTKGAQNAHRCLILEVTNMNTNQPDWKPPEVKFWPLTIGKTDDASFLKYRSFVDEVIREAFKIANIFLGTSGDINRAAAFTMREMTVNLVFAVIGETLARLLNNTLLPKWMEASGVNPDTCKVQIGFEVPKTMSQKDEAEILKLFASAGAYSPNDIRGYMGLDSWEPAWASIPTALAIVFAQMGLVDVPDSDALTDGMDLEGGETVPTKEDKLRHALLSVRKALEPLYRVDSSGADSFLANYFKELGLPSGDADKLQELIDEA